MGFYPFSIIEDIQVYIIHHPLSFGLLSVNLTVILQEVLALAKSLQPT